MTRHPQVLSALVCYHKSLQPGQPPCIPQDQSFSFQHQQSRQDHKILSFLNHSLSRPYHTLSQAIDEVAKGVVLVTLVNCILQSSIRPCHSHPTNTSNRLANIDRALAPLRTVDVLSHPVLWKA